MTRGEVEVLAATATERRYPLSREGTFGERRPPPQRCLGRWRARTLELCSTDTFIDCPFREQRTWVGDAYVETVVLFAVSRDWRLARRNLLVCAQDRRADGLVSMAACVEPELLATTIPEFSLHCVRTLARYFEYSGDDATVRELLPVAAEAIAALERYRESDGLLHSVPGFVFIDWAQLERGEVTTALDCLYVAALEDFAWLSESMSDSRAAAAARAVAIRSREAVEAQLWDDLRGVYVDSLTDGRLSRRVSQHSNAAAVIANCSPERWSRMIPYITDPERVVRTATDADGATADGRMLLWSDPAEFTAFDSERNVVLAQPFFAHFLHDAVARAGRHDLLVDLCLRWHPQLEDGHPTLLEHWTATPGRASRCHAWSATATFDLSRHLLGVRPLLPGYSRAEVRPYFGQLKRLAGHVPTPHGEIVLDLTRDGGRLTVPPGVTVVTSFEDAGIRGGELTEGTHELTA